MPFTEKRKKKLTRWIGGSDDKFNMIFIELCIQYFILFCIALSFDRIAKALTWRYNEGFGPGQIILAVICIVQMARYARKVKK